MTECQVCHAWYDETAETHTPREVTKEMGAMTMKYVEGCDAKEIASEKSAESPGA